ncbi:hypothetical protein CAPTEDRAFT_212024 [Capitella teleta]|uniref:Uncharacterized protein n=1 Tax=Capitella teleta TaxID=283909 RepID=R7UFH8_CAPTE|nr:hypothetical protein CAPTEDRAFT_212024 [Capitella teleta]|eukprot:ELU05294.1 hypothetical protein CAPTEDRAFT_212024 [Capitella teleta]
MGGKQRALVRPRSTAVSQYLDTNFKDRLTGKRREEADKAYKIPGMREVAYSIKGEAVDTTNARVQGTNERGQTRSKHTSCATPQGGHHYSKLEALSVQVLSGRLGARSYGKTYYLGLSFYGGY